MYSNCNPRWLWKDWNTTSRSHSQPWGMSWICLKMGILLKGYEKPYDFDDHPPSFVDICGVCFFWKKICKSETHCRCPQLQENKTCEQTHHQTHQTRDVSIMVIYTWISHLITLLLSIWLDFCSFDNLQSNFNDTHQRQFNWSSCGSFTTLQWTWAFLALSPSNPQPVSEATPSMPFKRSPCPPQ